MDFKTERTIIKPLSTNDFESLLEMYFEPGTNDYIAPLKDKTESFYRAFLEKKVLSNVEQISFWTVRDRVSSQIMGTMNLNLFEPLNIIHVGAHLKKDFWNQGYGKELFIRILRYGFEERKLPFIHAIVEVNHKVSKRLLTRLGFKLNRFAEVNGETLEIMRISSRI